MTGERIAIGFVVLSLGAGAGAEATAQVPTPAECAVISNVALARPSVLDTLALVARCPGAFGPVMATLLQDPNVFADSATYDVVVEWAASRMEPEIFAVALDDFADEGAHRLRRLAGAAILLKYVTPATATLDLRGLPASYSEVQGCAVGMGPRTRSGDAPLPGNAKAQAHSAAASVIAGSGPQTVRFLGHCLYFETTDSDPFFEPGPPPTDVFIPAQHFELEVLCGRRVLLRNKSRVSVSIRLVWGNSSSQVNANNLARDYLLVERGPSAPHFEAVWQVPSPTATKFRIQQVTNPWGAPPYVILHDIESLNTSPCP